MLVEVIDYILIGQIHCPCEAFISIAWGELYGSVKGDLFTTDTCLLVTTNDESHIQGNAV